MFCIGGRLKGHQERRGEKEGRKKEALYVLTTSERSFLLGYLVRERPRARHEAPGENQSFPRFIVKFACNLAVDNTIDSFHLELMPRHCSDPEGRRAALQLLSLGNWSPADVARCAGVSRQVVVGWARRAGVDWKYNRDERLKEAWRKEIERKEGIAPKRKPTKAHLRNRTQALTDDWLAKGGEIKKCP